VDFLIVICASCVVGLAIVHGPLTLDSMGYFHPDRTYEFYLDEDKDKINNIREKRSLIKMELTQSLTQVFKWAIGFVGVTLLVNALFPYFAVIVAAKFGAEFLETVLTVMGYAT